jgi:hypothetical protein
MKSRIRNVVPATVVVGALGLSGTLLITNQGGGATDTKQARVAVSDCKPAPAPCGSEESDLVIAAAHEAARRMHESETTGTTTVINPAP